MLIFLFHIAFPSLFRLKSLDLKRLDKCLESRAKLTGRSVCIVTLYLAGRYRRWNSTCSTRTTIG